jgi:hypothetical protein
MDADMQAMQSRMLRMSTVIKLLGATANSGGNGSANLTLVIQKLEDMKQAELEKAAVIESLKRRIGGVEQLEADHKDEHDMLVRPLYLSVYTISLKVECVHQCITCDYQVANLPPNTVS